MTAPTPVEFKLLEAFRQKIRDLPLHDWQKEDMFLLTWIRARENDLTKAEDMLRKSIAWRKKEDIDNIFSWQPPEEYFTAFKSYISGSDNEGRPVVYLPLGTWDIRKVVDEGHRTTYVRFVDQFVAGFIKAIREARAPNGDFHTQFVIIIDMTGLALRQFTSPSTIDTILETFRRFEANYPETLYIAFIINAPGIFPMAFNLVKPLLSQHTKNKIQIFNSNYNKWKPILSEKIPQKSFPKILQTGTIVSDSDYCKDDNENLGPNGSVTERNIESGGKLEIHVTVKSLNSILRWEFETDNYDINFAIFHGSTPITPPKRYDSHLQKVTGSTLCENIGKYTLTFDNSYSRFRSKIVRFWYSIQEAEES